MKTIRLFSMFSGYGGAEFALAKALIPFECVGYSEIDKNAIKCYELNHPNIKNFGDATKIDAASIPDFDLLTAGFPCQAFSLAGMRRGFEDTRGTLFREIIRIAELKKPAYMILENVKGILSHDEGRTFNIILSEIRRIGYDVRYKVCNTKDYGIPQNRERIIIVCKYGVFDFLDFQFPVEEKLSIRLKDILEENVDKKYYLSEDHINKILSRDRFGDKIFDGVPHISPTLLHIGRDDVSVINTENETDCMNLKKVFDEEHDKSQIRLEFSPTITTELSHSSGRTFNAESFKAITGQYRRLTPKECFRLMGFLDDKINLDQLSDTAKYKLAGNGWDINLFAKVFKRLYKKNLEERNILALFD